MSYLLMQIFICLLIAGLIGLLIGWLLRGGCRKKLLNNDDKWNSELSNINNNWGGQVQGLMSDQKSTLLSNNIKLSKLENQLNLAKSDAKDLDLDWSSKFSENNLLWENKLKSVTSDLNSKVENINQLWKKKLQETVAQSNAKLTLLNNSYSKVKTDLLVADNKVKGFHHDVDKLVGDKKRLETEVSKVKDEHKLLDSKWNTKFNDASNAWKEKIQGLIGNSDEKAKDLTDELNEMKTSFSRVEIENKEISSKLKSTEETSKELENKVQSLIRTGAERRKALSTEVNEVKIKLLKVEEENQKIEVKLKSTEVNSQNMKMRLEESEKVVKGFESENKKNSVDLLNTIYDWKQKYKILEGEKLLVETKLLNGTKSVESEKIITSKPNLLTQARNGKKDNLTLVKGIGKTLEERLNELGVYYFEQIASWTKEEQSWIDEKMSFLGRIAREEWISQASALASGEETEFSKRVKDGDVPSSKKQ